MTTTFPRATRTLDFWRVNSYGYPCFFSENENAQDAWATLLSFFDFTDYEALKAYWSSEEAPRPLTPHAVESWKATFEEFGILYVASRSNKITITPAGIQLREAADRDDRNEFAWIGLNLLLRYPLRGPRRPKSKVHQGSDLLLYRFWYAALLDLDGYIWWTELERILCRVFKTNEAMDAIEDVRVMRNQPDLVDLVDIPAEQRKGKFYNSLNQVVVHAGMNHLLLGSEDLETPYGVNEPKRKVFIHRDWRGMIRNALSNTHIPDQCTSGGRAIARLPSAPELSNENDFFSYIGAQVTPMSAHVVPSLSSAVFQGERVFLLKEEVHYTREGDGVISGLIESLCQLGYGQRVIFSHDERWTYIVEAKDIVDSYRVRIRLRRARPISNIDAVRTLLGVSHA